MTGTLLHMLNAWAVLWITESCPQTQRKIADVRDWCYLISITWNPITVKSVISCLLEKATKKVSVSEVVNRKHIPFKIQYLSPLLWKRGIYRRQLQQQFQRTFQNLLTSNLYVNMKCICTFCYFTKYISLSPNRWSPTNINKTLVHESLFYMSL